MNKKVSIVLCTYNEVNYVENTIRSLSETLSFLLGLTKLSVLTPTLALPFSIHI